MDLRSYKYACLKAERVICVVRNINSEPVAAEKWFKREHVRFTVCRSDQTTPRLQFMMGQLNGALIKTEYVCWTVFPFYPIHCELCSSLWEPLTMLEGFKGEPEEDD